MASRSWSPAALGGLVTDSQTGEAVPGAQITFHDSEGNSGTISANEGGLYAFDLNKGPIPARGMVTYEVTAPGYEALTVQRDVQYDDNPAGTWEAQHFALQPTGARYYNQEEGFSIAFPADWDIEEDTERERMAVVAYSPAESPEDWYHEHVFVLANDLGVGTDLEMYFEVNVAGMSHYLNAFQEYERGDAIVDGQDAKWVVFSYAEPRLKLKGLAYFVVKGDRGYSILCYAQFTEFPEYRSTFESIAQTFKFE